jgi:hypothetical protein
MAARNMCARAHTRTQERDATTRSGKAIQSKGNKKTKSKKQQQKNKGK